MGKAIQTNVSRVMQALGTTNPPRDLDAGIAGYKSAAQRCRSAEYV